MPTRVLQSEFVLGQARFLRTDDGSAPMNINGVVAGTPVIVWNGESTYWTPGDQGSSEAYAAKNGSNGWDSSSTSLGQDTKFDGGNNQDIAVYDTLSFWMQPKAYPIGSDLQVLWKTQAGTTKGDILSVEDYATNMDLDIWQHIEIPIADFNLQDDVDKVLFKYANKGGQQFWFDDIELNTSAGGGPYTFRVAAPTGIRWHVSMCVLLLGGVDTGWDSDAFATIPGGIENGLLIRQRCLSTAEVLWSLNSKDNIDLLGRYHPQESIVFADSVMLMGLMLKPGKASVVVTDDEVLEFIVRDDLSTLDQARAFIHYGTEEGA